MIDEILYEEMSQLRERELKFKLLRLLTENGLHRQEFVYFIIKKNRARLENLQSKYKEKKEKIVSEIISVINQANNDREHNDLDKKLKLLSNAHQNLNIKFSARKKILEERIGLLWKLV